jgi:hypothetical protein
MPSSMACVMKGRMGSTMAPACLEASCGRLHGRLHLGFDWQAAAGLQQQPDAQAAQAVGSLIELRPRRCPARAGSCCRGRRAGSAPASSRRRRPPCASWDRQRARCRAGRSECGPVARLEAEDAAPARRQAQRASDVGAHVQRAIAGRRRCRTAGAGAARRLAQVPGVAAQGMEARKPRRQHAVVRHRGLADQHRARFPQTRRRRRIVRARAPVASRRSPAAPGRPAWQCFP